MELIRHTLHWCKGEIFEGRMIMIFGILFLILTVSFWKFGFTTNAKAIIIPLLIVSLVHIGTGIAMIYSNTNRQIDFAVAYNKEPEKFKQSELKRTESFMKIYPLARIFSIAFIIIGFVLFALLPNPLWKSIGLCVMVLGFSVIVIDHFSEERANTYQNALMNGK